MPGKDACTDMSTQTDDTKTCTSSFHTCSIIHDFTLTLTHPHKHTQYTVETHFFLCISHLSLIHAHLHHMHHHADCWLPQWLLFISLHGQQKSETLSYICITQAHKIVLFIATVLLPPSQSHAHLSSSHSRIYTSHMVHLVSSSLFVNLSYFPLIFTSFLPSLSRAVIADLSDQHSQPRAHINCNLVPLPPLSHTC